MYREHEQRARIARLVFHGFPGQVVDAFAKWIEAPRRDRDDVEVLVALAGCEGYHEWILAWLLGDALRARGFQDDVLGVLIHRYRYRTATTVAISARGLAPYLDEVPRQSSLHFLLVDILCCELEKMDSDRERRAILTQLDKSTLYDVAARIFEERNRQLGAFVPTHHIERYYM